MVDSSETVDIIAVSRVEHIPIDKIDLTDRTYRFRAALRIGPLKASIASDGQQMPIVVRKVGRGRAQRFQLISGFRRTTAMEEMGLGTVAAIVRTDLDDDEAAFRAAVLENSQRKTYSDIDRALVVRSYTERGYKSVDIAALMGLSKRQTRNLKSLLELPASVQAAVDEPNSMFTATHALVLMQLKGKYPKLRYDRWIDKVQRGNDGQGLSVSQLKRAINAAYRDEALEAAMGSIFRADETKGTVFRFNPVKIDVAQLSEEDKASLKSELAMVLAALE
ncbi:MAG: ParB/RepB/Spo0J family partition protein [Proteobacteria bacterium]|jgi:ParB/RepB/Spo0J family partition protein|nr:ParB/RepB/Spo0J family partition protein [Pseudomonadota bacterium]